MKTVFVRAVERCLGCRSCELACAVAHSKAKCLLDVVLSEEKPQTRVHVEAVGERAVPIHCRHCEEAACVLVCPTRALSKCSRDKPVVVDATRCVGCRFCVEACPFGVIVLSREGRGVVKCDLCAERLSCGEDPACVAACPTRALIWADEEEVNRIKRHRAAAKLVAAQELESDRV